MYVRCSSTLFNDKFNRIGYIPVDQWNGTLGKNACATSVISVHNDDRSFMIVRKKQARMLDKIIDVRLHFIRAELLLLFLLQLH